MFFHLKLKICFIAKKSYISHQGNTSFLMKTWKFWHIWCKQLMCMRQNKDTRLKAQARGRPDQTKIRKTKESLAVTVSHPVTGSRAMPRGSFIMPSSSVRQTRMVALHRKIISRWSRMYQFPVTQSCAMSFTSVRCKVKVIYVNKETVKMNCYDVCQPLLK